MEDRLDFSFIPCYIACGLLFFDLSGGILGWDPVLTTCILCEMVKLRDTHEMNEGPHHSHRVIMRNIAKQFIMKHHISHILTKKFIKILLNNYFLSEIQFLLVISKIPAPSSVHDILIILITPLIIFL